MSNYNIGGQDDDSNQIPPAWVEYCSINDAALHMGCDHHYVRNLISQGRIDVHHTEPINKSVNKVFVTKTSVKLYIEAHRERHQVKLACTDEEERAVRRLLQSMRVLQDW